jgi:hypothetical protein
MAKSTPEPFVGLPSNCRGVQRPLRRGMPQERGAVVLDIRWQLDAQWVLDLWRLQQHRWVADDSSGPEPGVSPRVTSPAA